MVSKALTTTACGTGRPFSNRPTLVTTGVKEVPPRLFWGLVGSGLSLRRTAHGWRTDCPCDPAHTVAVDYRKVEGREDSVLYVHCWPQTNGGYDGDGCPTLKVLTAVGCSLRDLYQQTRPSADGTCSKPGCRNAGYRVNGVGRNKPICLPHLLDETGQPRALLFGDKKS